MKSWPVFIKSVKEKRFTGCVVSSTADLVGKGCLSENFLVICGNALDMKLEYCLFVCCREILDVRHYQRDWLIASDRLVVESVVNSYVLTSSGYVTDYVVNDDKRTIL